MSLNIVYATFIIHLVTFIHIYFQICLKLNKDDRDSWISL